MWLYEFFHISCCCCTARKLTDNNEAGFGLCLLSSCRLSELMVARLTCPDCLLACHSAPSVFPCVQPQLLFTAPRSRVHVVNPSPCTLLTEIISPQTGAPHRSGVTLTSLKGNTTNFHSHSVAKLHCGCCKGRIMCGIKKRDLSDSAALILIICFYVFEFNGGLLSKPGA